MRLQDANLSVDDRSILLVARYFFKSFAVPEDQGWIRAFDVSRQIFGDAMGACVGTSTLDLVQEMRRARRSCFRYSNPDCPGCALILCAAERHLILTLNSLARGAQSEALAHALLLSEGNSPDAFLAAAQDLVNLLKANPRKTSKTRKPSAVTLH